MAHVVSGIFSAGEASCLGLDFSLGFRVRALEAFQCLT